MTTAASSSSNGPPLGKYLASTEKKVRDKAIKNLAAFLSDTENELPEAEINKLWKGIFYCFWMSDKPLVQQALAQELAELVLTIPDDEKSLQFLRGFWITLVREWNGIDRLRMDKYYLLIRRFVNVSFRLLIRADFEPMTCEELNDIISGPGGPLSSSDLKVPAGLGYHLSDLYLEELDKALASTPSSSKTPSALSAAAFQNILQPFVQLAASTSNTTLFKRVQDSVLEPVFTSVLPPSASTQASDSDSDEEEDGRAKKRARQDRYPHLSDRIEESERTRSALAKHIFETASQEDTLDSNRRKLYKI